MANDFKRMWTKEELKDTYVLKLDNWYSTENYESYGFSKEQLDSINNFDKVLVIDNNGWGFLFVKQRIEKDGNLIYEMIDNNAIYMLCLGYDETPNFYVGISRIELIVEDQYENLVSATPTDVSIIEDQGKLELMLEHDGNVLAINDTPNQFLQRRLDKPSEVITLTTSGSNVYFSDTSKYSSLTAGKFVNVKLTTQWGTYNCYGIVIKSFTSNDGEISCGYAFYEIGDTRSDVYFIGFRLTAGPNQQTLFCVKVDLSTGSLAYLPSTMNAITSAEIEVF